MSKELNKKTKKFASDNDTKAKRDSIDEEAIKWKRRYSKLIELHEESQKKLKEAQFANLYSSTLKT